MKNLFSKFNINRSSVMQKLNNLFISPIFFILLFAIFTISTLLPLLITSSKSNLFYLLTYLQTKIKNIISENLIDLIEEIGSWTNTITPDDVKLTEDQVSLINQTNDSNEFNNSDKNLEEASNS